MKTSSPPPARPNRTRAAHPLARVVALTAAAVVTLTGLTAPAYAEETDAGALREILTPNDGWAALGPGTTGGSAATEVTTVRTWEEFRAALGGKKARTQTTPRIIRIEGEISAFGFDDEANALPTCADFAARIPIADDGPPRTFSMTEYITHFDPATWGMTPPAGPLEDARRAAAAEQSAQVQQYVGSNVTIMGADNASLSGAHLLVQGATNVILRNFESSDAYDCFPEWDPLDGATGNWNSLYDNVSLHTSTHVWVDHMTFNDGTHPRQALPTVFGRHFEVHDGLLDITHSSDLVTVSYSLFDNHDKTNLVGSSDGRAALDTGLLRVTWHHNYWRNAGQRAPRVRFGDVDVYNNYFEITDSTDFTYLLGAGMESSIYAEKNAFWLPPTTTSDRIVHNWGGRMIRLFDSHVNGLPEDVLGAYNAAASAQDQLENTARWTPHLRTIVHPVDQVATIAQTQAGANRLAAPPATTPPSPAPTRTSAATQPTAESLAPPSTQLSDTGSTAGELAATGADTGHVSLSILLTLIPLGCAMIALRSRRSPRGTPQR